MRTRRVPIRRLERERLAAIRARERRRRLLRLLKWGIVLGIVGLVIASLTYGYFFAPYRVLRSMLAMPTRLQAVVVMVNDVPHVVPAEGTLVVHPDDVVTVADVRTDGHFKWGLRLESKQFPANQLLEGRRRLGKFWPDYDYADPLKVVVKVQSGAEKIGRFHLVVRLRARDWVRKAQEVSKIEEKIAFYERAARLSPQNALILTNLARLYAEQGSWGKAASTYEKVAAFSATIPILEKLIEAHQKAGNVDGALGAYLRLIQTNSRDREAFYGFISYLNAKKKAQEAAAFLEKNIDIFPPEFKPEVYAYLGTLHGQTGRWQEATRAYKRALTGGVKNPLVYLNLGEAYVRIKRYGDAERYLERYLQIKPKDADAKLRLVEVYRRQGKNKSAIKLLKEIIREQPKMLKAHLALVDLYEKEGMIEAATEAYEAIAKLAPENKVVRYNQGVLYYEMKQLDRAIAAFNHVIRLDSKDIDARQYLLRIYLEKKDKAKAAEVLEELVKLQPSQFDYYPQMFELYDELGAYERMTQTFSAAVGRAPERPELRFFLGLAYEKRGLLPEAVHQFEEALKLAPRNKEYLAHIAALYEKLGQSDKALDAYQALLEIDPDNEQAQESYMRLKLEKLQRETGGS